MPQLEGADLFTDPHYGGSGVFVCERWFNSFENFLADLGLRVPGTTRGRFGDIGNYNPGVSV